MIRALRMNIKSYDFTPSVEGDRKKKIYKLNSTRDQLVQVQEIDQQDYINSFLQETNYKGLIEKLHNPEDIAQYSKYHTVNYGDSTMFSPSYLENMITFREAEATIDYLKKLQEIKLGKQNQATDVGKEKEINESEQV